jgi:hypothetical protein
MIEARDQSILAPRARGAASALRTRVRLKYKATKAEFYRMTKIKFARREGGISFAANDKNFIRKDRRRLGAR